MPLDEPAGRDAWPHRSYAALRFGTRLRKVDLNGPPTCCEGRSLFEGLLSFRET